MPSNQAVKPRLPAWPKYLIMLHLMLAGSLASAAVCSVSSQGLVFGTYDTFSSQSLESAGNIDISCDSLATYSIALSTGSGSFLQRTMVFGSRVLNYNLFTDAARTIVWGDGTGSTATVSGVTGSTASHSVYGRVPARQNAYVGNYSDNVTITINF